LQLLGEGPPSGTSFYARGTSTIISQTIDVRAGSITIEGNLWLEAETATIIPQARIFVVNGGHVGWGPNQANQYPWNEVAQTLEQPYEDEAPDDLLAELAIGLARRVPGGTPLVLTESYTPISDDPLTRWAVRRFSSQLAELIKLLVKHSMASTEPLGIGGSERKVRVRVNFAWWDLVAALQGPAPARWVDFIAEARNRI
jgi:hypothetical protein